MGHTTPIATLHIYIYIEREVYARLPTARWWRCEKIQGIWSGLDWSGLDWKGPSKMDWTGADWNTASFVSNLVNLALCTRLPATAYRVESNLRQRLNARQSQRCLWHPCQPCGQHPQQVTLIQYKYSIFSQQDGAGWTPLSCLGVSFNNRVSCWIS